MSNVGPLADHAMIPPLDHDLGLHVANTSFIMGGWDLQYLGQLLISSICQLIAGIHPPNPALGDDGPA